MSTAHNKTDLETNYHLNSVKQKEISKQCIVNSDNNYYLSVPLSIRDYNKNMRESDENAQQQVYYTSHIRSA